MTDSTLDCNLVSTPPLNWIGSEGVRHCRAPSGFLLPAIAFGTTTASAITLRDRAVVVIRE